MQMIILSLYLLQFFINLSSVYHHLLRYKSHLLTLLPLPLPLPLPPLSTLPPSPLLISLCLLRSISVSNPKP